MAQEKAKIPWNELGEKRLLLLVAAAIGLLLLAWPQKAEEKTSNHTQVESVFSEDEPAAAAPADDNVGDLENRLKKLLVSMDGVGEAEVMITWKASEEKVLQEIMPQIEGVVVSCDGGGEAKVKTEIAEAVGALFDVPAHKIKVLKRVSGKS